MIISRVTVYDPHLYKNILVEGRGQTEEEADRQIEALLKEHGFIPVFIGDKKEREDL
jgi:hypothetical protein